MRLTLSSDGRPAFSPETEPELVALLQIKKDFEKGGRGVTEGNGRKRGYTFKKKVPCPLCNKRVRRGRGVGSHWAHSHKKEIDYKSYKAKIPNP